MEWAALAAYLADGCLPVERKGIVAPLGLVARFHVYEWRIKIADVPRSPMYQAPAVEAPAVGAKFALPID